MQTDFHLILTHISLIGEFFWVPAGNDYKVKAIGKRGELRFHLLKNRKMLDPEEQEDDEDGPGNYHTL